MLRLLLHLYLHVFCIDDTKIEQWVQMDYLYYQVLWIHSCIRLHSFIGERAVINLQGFEKPKIVHTYPHPAYTHRPLIDYSKRIRQYYTY